MSGNKNYKVLASVIVIGTIIAGCTGNEDSTSSAPVTSDTVPAETTLEETTVPATDAPTTTEERHTGTFQSCDPGKEFLDPDNDGWGGCVTPTTTTVDVVIPEGVYQVGTEFQPGVYRVLGYWARLDAAQEIIDNEITDDCSSIMVVKDTDAYVDISGAAINVNDSIAVDPITEGCTDGTFLVGYDIAPGQYKVMPVDGNAYWARLDGDLEIIDNDIGEGQLIVVIQAGDYAINISGTLQLM